MRKGCQNFFFSFALFGLLFPWQGHLFTVSFFLPSRLRMRKNLLKISFLLLFALEFHPRLKMQNCIVELFLNALNNGDFFLRFSIFSLLSSLSEEEDEDELEELFCFMSEPSSAGKTTSIFCLTSLSIVSMLFFLERDAHLQETLSRWSHFLPP